MEVDFLETRRPYAVVKWPDENNSGSVVPVTWLVKSSSGYLCKWPLKGSKKLSKKNVKPAEDWKAYKAEPIRFSRTYQSADVYLKKYLKSIEFELYSSDTDHNKSLRRMGATDAGPSVSAVEGSALYENESPSHYSPAPTDVLSISDFHRLEAKVDSLIKITTELKADQEICKETLRRLCRQDMLIHKDLLLNQSFKPLETFSEILEFEEKLKSEEEFAKAVARCGGLGGKDFKDATRRILSSLFSHAMAMRLCWNKANGKESIQKFPNILLFINVSLRANKEFKETSECSVEDVLKKWLRQAPDRNGGRIQRMKSKIAS